MGDATNMREALASATIEHAVNEAGSTAQAFGTVIAELASNPELAAAWRDVLIEFAPTDAESELLDFPDQTPAERIGIDGTVVRRKVGLNGISFTGPQVNALVEAAQLTGNWSRPGKRTWAALVSVGLITTSARLQLTEKGEAWLRAEGLLRDEPATPSATPCDCGWRGVGMHTQSCALFIAERAGR